MAGGWPASKVPLSVAIPLQLAQTSLAITTQLGNGDLTLQDFLQSALGVFVQGAIHAIACQGRASFANDRIKVERRVNIIKELTQAIWPEAHVVPLHEDEWKYFVSLGCTRFGISKADIKSGTLQVTSPFSVLIFLQSGQMLHHQLHLGLLPATLRD